MTIINLKMTNFKSTAWNLVIVSGLSIPIIFQVFSLKFTFLNAMFKTANSENYIK
jgi:hypothetical protein